MPIKTKKPKPSGFIPSAIIGTFTPPTNPRSRSNGFTIVELIITIVVIAILTIIGFLSYVGITVKAIDSSIMSDVSNMDKKQKVYLVSNETAKEYYSGLSATYDSSLDYRPSSGNIIDVVTDGQDYCIRGYNVKGNINSLANAYTRGSSSTACTDIPPSTEAEDDDPDGGGGEGGGGITSGWKQISTGQYHTCAISFDDKAYCWGYGGNGALGNNSNDDTFLDAVAVDTSGVLSGKTIKLIAAGDTHTCAIASDKRVYCWGSGYLGSTEDTDDFLPVAVDTSGVLSGKTIKSLAVGLDHSCVIASDDLAYCWGRNDNSFHGVFSRLGINSIVDNSIVPVAVYTGGVLSGKTFKAIAAGYEHSCAIASDNKPYCWGRNQHGQLGDGTNTNSIVPVAVSTSGVLSGKNIKSISVGEDYSCVIASDNQVYCWGNGDNGELGNNLATDSNVPVAVDTSGVLNGKTIKSISAGGWHTCVVASDRQAYCWGADWSGELGINTTEYSQSDVPVAVVTSGALSGKTIKSISAREYHTCAIASDNRVYCWGWNSDGQLGDKTTNDSTVPILAQPSP